MDKLLGFLILLIIGAWLVYSRSAKSDLAASPNGICKESFMLMQNGTMLFAPRSTGGKVSRIFRADIKYPVEYAVGEIPHIIISINKSLLTDNSKKPHMASQDAWVEATTNKGCTIALWVGAIDRVIETAISWMSIGNL